MKIVTLKTEKGQKVIIMLKTLITSIHPKIKEAEINLQYHKLLQILINPLPNSLQAFAVQIIRIKSVIITTSIM